MHNTNVHIGADVFQDFVNVYKLESYSSIFVLTDTNTSKYCLPIFKTHFTKDFFEISINAGEEFKTLKTCEYIWEQLINNKADRNSLLICLGGGMVTDIGAFCASVYMRGIDFCLFPTTLLSMTDASVGGKTGVDFLHFKNIIGTFSAPIATLVNAEFLKTLPNNQIKSGFAEMIKHALIYSENHWDEIKKTDLNNTDLEKLLVKSVAIKQEIVTKDPKEKGLRKTLNFGHTVGHAIESCFLKTNNPILHGEAVALGILAECFIANEICILFDDDFEEIITFLKSIYTIPTFSNFEEIADLCLADKKNNNGIILMSLIEAPGNAIFGIEIEKQLIIKSLEFLNSIK
jgi:3-dehydroquinate synthase